MFWAITKIRFARARSLEKGVWLIPKITPPPSRINQGRIVAKAL